MNADLAALAERCAVLFPEGVQLIDYAKRGFHLDLKVDPSQVVEAARLFEGEGFAIDTLTGVDWIKEEQFEVVYDYYHPRHAWRVAVRTRIPRDNPTLPTISPVFPGANWHEREARDFFGIHFAGHPNMEPLLLPEDADYHPLRKDFAA